MKPRNLIIASVILAGLAGAIYWAQKHPSTGSSDGSTPVAGPKIADIPAGQIQSVQIARRDGSTVSLQKQNARWVITAPQPYGADQDVVSSVLSPLSPLNADSVVEENASNLSQYGLDKPTVTLSIHQNSGQTQTLTIGNDVPTTAFVYAKWNSSLKVYALASTTKTAIDKTVNDLRDKRLLTVASAKWNRLAIKTAKGDMEFSKNAQSDWAFDKPQPFRTDTLAVTELVRKLADARMDLNASTDDQAKAQAGFAAGQPIASVTVASDAGPQTLLVRKNKDDYYATSSVVAGTYKVDSDLGQALDKGTDDFRNKKLFEFGFDDPDKVTLDQRTYLRAGSDWKSNGKTMDPATVQSFIEQLRGLTATKFVTSGFTQPTASLTVQWNGYKNTETVAFSGDANGYVARRSGDPSLYALDAKAVNDMLNAGKAIKPAAKK